MTAAKSYFRDRFVLLLLSIDCFLVVLVPLVIGLNIGAGGKTDYFIQYRANLGLSAFTNGGVQTFWAFMVFAVATTVFNIFLSFKVYHIKRHFTLAILSASSLLLVLTLVISTSLLINHR